MKSTRTLRWLLLLSTFLFSQSAGAVPVFQTAIDGGTPGSIGPDEDTWFTTSSTFDLIVAGAYCPRVKSLEEVTLLVSVPKGQTGTIEITADNQLVLLTEKTPAADAFFNPNDNAVIDLLLNEAGNDDGFDAYRDLSFLPQHANFNEHYPLKEDLSNLILYRIGSLERHPKAVSNYSTTEPIEYNIADGQEKRLTVSITGFTSAHFDLYGYVEFLNPPHDACGRWVINPGSHDATYMVPEPATALLLALGGSILFPRRRRTTGPAAR